MKDGFPDICRHISIFSRLMEMYYNRCLSGCEIGWGQQFYVEYICAHPGATPQEIVRHIRVDKATLTKVIRKLLDIEYITVETDGTDGRVKHLYPTEKAVSAADRIKKIHAEFYGILRENTEPSDFKLTERTIKRIADNLNDRIKHRPEVKSE